MLDSIISFFVKYSILGILLVMVLGIVLFFVSSIVKTLLIVGGIVIILVICKPITSYLLTLYKRK